MSFLTQLNSTQWWTRHSCGRIVFVISIKYGEKKCTHKKDNVNDDEDVFDEIYAAASRVTSLWFLDFDLFLLLRRWLFTLCSSSVFALVMIIVVVIRTTDIIVVVLMIVAVGCAILG